MHYNIDCVIMQNYVTMDKLSTYLRDIFGVQIALKVVGEKKISALPYFLKVSYSLSEGVINGLNVIFAKLNNEKNATPNILVKQGDLLEKQMNAKVVFVFDRLEAYERKRLIEKKIAFLEPFKQLYIPSLMLELNNISKRKTETVIVGEKLSVSVQLAVLFHLQIKPLNNIPLQEIAELLHYSRMTVTRIIRELAAFNICEIKGVKEKVIEFKENGKLLWDIVHPRLNSPVSDVWFTDERIDKQLLKSYDTALTHYSELSEGRQVSYAIGKDEFREIKATELKQKINKKFGEYRIEIWNYNPLLLTQNKEVDCLSLFLSMEKENDPRVQMALTEMINNIKWL